MGFTTTAAVSGALLTTLLLAGCTSPSSNVDTSSTSESAVEVSFVEEMFVLMMIPHHEQAVEMAELILAKDDIDPRVVELAEGIMDAQEPEIETMRGWLAEWGVAEWDSSMADMGHGDGMMSDSDLAALDVASGADATRLFLEQMIVHHDGAIEMAQAVVDSGQDSDVIALAQAIIDGQTTEINIMRELLNEL
ncbi:DUF305 domain-containing protein [uncultured Schumannella sp.]|uniref:DUF305 domain-containing protein n=1 Tax=uncultured Schumannella sp. TaxID=1195956 RepID=UPI0025E5BC44|nr:DUF305 domain-containing protein [uncultured Schumannella sp.]